MSTFSDTLKSRLLDAEKRLQEAQQNMRKVQQEFQSASAEAASWKNAVQFEALKEKDAASVDTPSQSAASATEAQSHGENANENNKTELVRQLLRQNPTGIAPAEIWKKLNGQITNRAYMYSVLKRLKDRGDATARRGKYFAKINPRSEDIKEQTTPLIQ